MAERSISWYIFTIGLLNLINKTHLTNHQNSHEYISANGRYFDDFSFIEREISGLPAEVGDSKKFQIKFDPSSLDFRQRPLGVPHIRKVHLFNFDTNRSIDMTSISGSTVHFHSSFFSDKKIPPMGNTSFNVVFLGRGEGYIESCLFIHTNNGHFKYNVKGVSVHSPYFLRPIVDIKLPLNVTFSPLIYLHNPHSEPIQIMEIYTSGGDFQLELPTGETEGPKKLWEIGPYETKSVIRVKFTAKIEQNYTAFVRIRLNITEEILVVPLEIEVGPKGGIYSPQGFLDFGLGGSLDKSKSINLCLFNTFTKPIKIQSVTTVSKAIRIDFKEPFILAPNIKGECEIIANLTVDWKKALKYEDFNGKIEIKYRNGKSIVDIPYFLSTLEGGLTYDAQVTKYFTNDKVKNLPRGFKLKNEFNRSIFIMNVSLSEDAQKYFKIDNFEPIMLRSKEDRSIFTINLKSGVKLSNVVINSHIEIRTNVSRLLVPLITYEGKLKLFLPFKSKDYSLDVGLISFNTKKEVNFLMYNDNPVRIQIKDIKTSIPLTSTSVVGCARGDPRIALLNNTFEHLHSCNIIRPNEYVVLKLIVQTANNEGHVWGETQIETEYEHLSIPVQFRVAAGKLEIGPDRLVFDQCFPGKICSHPLRVHSTFNEAMIIKNIISLPPDPRLSCKHNGHILAHTTKIVGHLYLNPNIECGSECYTGLNQEVQETWVKMSSLPSSIVHFDLDLFNTLYNRFLNATSNGLKKWQNLTLRIDTSEVKNHIFKTRVKMSWPSLILENSENNHTIQFPLTQLKNTTYRNVTIKNPSNKNLLVQVLLEQNYPRVELLYEGLPSVILPKQAGAFSTATNSNFFIENNGAVSPPFLLKPGENQTVLVGFHAEKPGDFATLLILRSNLTVLELLRLQARSSEAVFRFGNRKPGGNQPLIFEFTEKHYRSCESGHGNFAVKRSFTARNIGEIAIEMRRFFVNEEQCEGHGFKVLNCEPFVLQPNATRKIEIEFTPDFTLSKITRLLVIENSCNFNINYTLLATIPSYYINACSKIIKGPFWEYYLGYTAIVVMSVTLFLILIISIIDAEKIKKQSTEVIFTPSVVHPVLDLRLLGQQIKEEVHSNRENSKGSEKKSENAEPKSSGGSVLIPTVGKSKKKLIKKTENDENLKRNNDFYKVCNNNKKDECKKPSQLKDKKIVKKKLEDETNLSSMEYSNLTATAATVPTEDEIKEKSASNGTKSSVVKKLRPVESTATYEEVKDDALKTSEKTNDKKKTKQTWLLKPKEVNNENKKIEGGSNNKRKKEPKEKLSRKSLEKQMLLGFGSTKNEQQNQQIQSGNNKVWSLENRATFSDVVARTEGLNSNNSNRTTVTMIKPTMYVEPYKQQKHQQQQPFGPIGTKPIDFWHNDSNQNQPKIENVNSYFSNYESTNSQAFSNFEIQGNNDDWMKKNENYQPYCEAATTLRNNRVITDYNILDPWNRNLSTNMLWSGQNSQHQPHHSIMENSSPISTHLISNLNNGQQFSGNEQNNYLWGSSSVWQPWNPSAELTQAQRPSTRIPPGFNNVNIQQNVGNELTTHTTNNNVAPTVSQVYNPFTSNNLWSQEENIWRYLKDQ